MKREGLIFSRLQNFKKIRYPQFIKDILLELGFDTAASLNCIKKSTIQDIEKFVNNKLDLLKDTKYIDETGNLKKTPFKFMFGHELLILNIPQDIKEYNSRKKVPTSDIASIEKLKLIFIERTKQFAQKKNITLTLNSEDLSNFEPSDNCMKCEAKCPFCPKKTICMFDTSWKLSNYNKHIISCAKKIAIQTTPIQPRIERASEPSALLLELKNALP